MQPFVIKSADEVFQKNNEEVFAGIPGVHIVADDIIITAKSNQDHDHILTQVLESAKDRNIVFNLHKLQLLVNKVKYLGTIVISEGTKPDPSKVRAIVEMTSPTDKAGIRCLHVRNDKFPCSTHPKYAKHYSYTSMSVKI